jgi:hypothetical protein
MRVLIGFASLVSILVPILSAQSEVPKSIADSVGNTLRLAEGQLLSIAEAMPKKSTGLYRP